MIDIFTTGGTIDKVYFDALSEYQIGPTALPDILAENNVLVPHQVTQLMRKDSLDITDADRAMIHAAVLASGNTQILVTHGTDTMVQTGRMLADVCGKTIVLTGAMQPATLRASDADERTDFRPRTREKGPGQQQVCCRLNRCHLAHDVGIANRNGHAFMMSAFTQ
jgi:L-asparaginase